MQPVRLVAFAILLSLALPSSSGAQEAAETPLDEVVTKNGSRILGTVTKLEGGTLTMNTAYAEALELKFDEVQSLTCAGVQTLVLKDGTRLVGTPRMNDEGRLEVMTELGGLVTIDLESINAVNPVPKKAVKHRGVVTLSSRVTDGNTRVKSAAAAAEYEARSDSNRLTLRGDWNYAEDEGELSARSARAFVKYDYFFSKRGFGYVNASFFGDDFADLNLQTTIGAGVGYQFFDRNLDDKPIDFYEEAGVSFFDQDFDRAADDRYAAGRIAGNLRWNIVVDRVELFHNHEFFVGFESQDDLNAETKTGVRLTIVANFFASAQVNYRWDNTPSPGNRRNDTEYLLGLGYSFDR